MDTPYHANAEPLGRNKEVTNEWTEKAKAEKVYNQARKSAKGRPKLGDNRSGKSTVSKLNV